MPVTPRILFALLVDVDEAFESVAKHVRSARRSKDLQDLIGTFASLHLSHRLVIANGGRSYLVHGAPHVDQERRTQNDCPHGGWEACGSHVGPSIVPCPAPSCHFRFHSIRFPLTSLVACRRALCRKVVDLYMAQCRLFFSIGVLHQHFRKIAERTQKKGWVFADEPKKMGALKSGRPQSTLGQLWALKILPLLPSGWHKIKAAIQKKYLRVIPGFRDIRKFG